jgi:hypothetical protein
MQTSRHLSASILKQGLGIHYNKLRRRPVPWHPQLNGTPCRSYIKPFLRQDHPTHGGDDLALALGTHLDNDMFS